MRLGGEPVVRVMSPEKFQIFRGRSDIPIAERVQLPLALGYAITIHRSQGMSAESLRVCLPSVSRCPLPHGLVYVAMSRCRSLTGLTLLGDDWEEVLKRIVVDPRVKKFYDKLSR